MADLNALAETMWQHILAGRSYPADMKGTMTGEEGYAMGLKMLERHLQNGEKQVGWKVGLTAKAIQVQEDYHQPIFGYLLKKNNYASGDSLAFDSLNAPGCENELCVTLGKDLQGPNISVAQAAEAISQVAPALEIIERRGPFNEDLGLTFSDNVQQRAFVTGTPMPFSGSTLAETTLTFLFNGEQVDQSTGAAVMEDPVNSVAWLANTLHSYGYQLKAGQRIMTGSFTRQYPLKAGDFVESRFEPFGTVRFSLT